MVLVLLSKLKFLWVYGSWIWFHRLTSLFFMYFMKLHVQIPCSFVAQLEFRYSGISRTSFTIQDFLAILGVLFHYMKLRIVLSRSVKNYLRILVGIILNMYIAFGRILILLMHEQVRSHVLISPTSFFKDLKFYHINLSLAWLELPKVFYII